MTRMQSTMKPFNYLNHYLLKEKNGSMKILQEKYLKLLPQSVNGCSQCTNIMKNHKLLDQKE